MDQLKSLWSRLSLSIEDTVPAAPESASNPMNAILRRLPASLVPESWRQGKLEPQSLLEFYGKVVSDNADLLLAVGLALLGLAVLWVAYQVLHFIFAPYSKDWIAPRSKPKRYPKSVVDALPPPYPNGWYRLVRTSDLSRGELRQVELCGRTLAVSRAWKDVDGHPVIRAVDALCPHLGANLSEGRVTKDGCIECPFHAWKFDLQAGKRFAGGGCGKLKEIPYSQQSVASVPTSAGQLNVYETEEANGIVFVWIDSENRRGKEIPFRPYAHPKIAPNYRGSIFSGYKYHGETTHYIRAHIAELPENGSDASHFKYTHQESILPNLLPMLEHDMTGFYDDSGKPVLELKVVHILRLFGLGVSTMKTKVVQCGPGFAVLHIDNPGLGEVVIVETITPIYPMLVRTTHTCYTPLWIPRPLAKVIFGGMVLQYDRDAEIFDKKIPLPQPTFVKGENAILAYRRWWKQFYGPSSQSMKDAIDECEVGFVGGGGGWTEFGEIDRGVSNGEGKGKMETDGRRKARRERGGALDW